MTGSIQSRGGGLPAYPPWGTHAVPRAFNKHKSPSDFISYLIKVQKGAVRESIPHQETAALLGRCRTRCCLSPTPIPSAVRNPYFIHNGKERAERCGLGSKWLLFVLGKEDSSYHPPFHPLQEEVPQSPSPTSVCGRSQLLDISSKNTTVNVCKHLCANTHRPLLDHLALSKYNPRK